MGMHRFFAVIDKSLVKQKERIEKRADAVMTENEKKIGQSIDYSI